MRLPKIKISLPQIIAVLGLVQQGYEAVKKILKRGKVEPSRDEQNEGKEIVEKLQALKELKEKLKADPGNPILLMLLAQLNVLIEFVAEKAPEAAEKYIVAGAQTVLIWVPFAEAHAATTATQIDDVVYKEIHQAAEALAA